MQKFILLTCLFLSINLSFAQTWDGDAGDGDWNNPLNWDNDQVPLTGETVVITMNATITGTVPNNPARINIGANRIIDLDLTVTITSAGEHAFTIGNNSIVNLTGGTYTLNPPSNKNGFAVFGETNNPTLTIGSGATVNINGGSNAFNCASPTGTFNNEGQVNIDGSSNGVRLTGGTFSNSGTMTIANCVNDGIYTETSFVNTETGVITSNFATDDCIEIALGTFDNDGTINFECLPTAGTVNNGIAVGTSTTTGTLNNTSNNSINGNGGTGGTARPIYVFEMGALNNTGTISLEGGNSGAILYNRGTTTNANGATIDLGTDGRVNVNQGTFTNDGLLSTDRAAAGVLTSGTSTNNGFYDYASIQAFSIGTGTITDNGIDLTNSADTEFDASGGNTIDVGVPNYAFTYNGGDTLATSDASGILTIPDGELESLDPLTLSPAPYPAYSIVVSNYNVLLPIELANFHVSKAADGVKIQWETISEVNVDYVSVEKSTDGMSFTSIHRELSNGDAYEHNTYEVMDKGLVSGINYYRLKTVDLNGEIEYSEIKSISLRGEDSLESINVYPTITDGNMISIDLSGVKSDNVNMRLINSQGTQLMNINYIGGQEQSIDVASLPQGLYFIMLDNGISTTTRRILKN